VIQKWLSHWPVFGGVWILATVIGTAPLTLPYVVDRLLIAPSSISLYAYVVWGIALATLMGLSQYIVLRALIGRESISAVAWIPATVLVAVVAVITIAIWQVVVIPNLGAIGALEPLMQPGFPGVQIITELYAIPAAALLGVVQGLVLSNIYGRSLVRPWLFANVAAALGAVIIQGIAYLEMAHLVEGMYIFDAATFATAEAFRIGGIFLSVVLYAAVTGLTLFELARPRNGVSKSSATPSGSLIKKPI
jgi:hypothetical protein